MALTQFFLMNPLWNQPQRDVKIWVNTMFTLISWQTKIVRFVKGPKLSRHHAEDKGEAVPRVDNFGDLITADHKVLSDNCESRNNHRYAVVVQDLATQWIQAYPCKNKTSQETQRSLQKFLEPERKPKVIYTDNSLEFGKACEDLSWNHRTSTPHRSETDGIAERAVRRVKEGTSAVLLQSGLNESWWADSMECYTYLRNVTDLLSDGKTPYERRFGQLGSLVEYYPITAKDQSRIHQFGKKVFPGLFLGYALYVGGIWKGDVLIADLEELETMDASEIYSKRLNAKEVIFPKKGEFTFPIASGRIKTPGEDQALRTSTLVQPRPIQGENNSSWKRKKFAWNLFHRPGSWEFKETKNARNWKRQVAPAQPQKIWWIHWNTYGKLCTT